jgi:hypothetical protein
MTFSDALQKVGWSDPERSGEAHDRRQPWVTPGPLEQRDLRAMQITGMTERLLRQVPLLPVGPQVLGELMPSLHANDPPAWQTEPLQTKPLPRTRV